MLDKEKYIYVRGKKITVSDEVYKAYKKELNHETHLNRMDIKHRVWAITRLHLKELTRTSSSVLLALVT